MWEGARNAFQDACERQAIACSSLGSPFTARLCRALAEVLVPSSATGSFLLSLTGDLGPSGLSLPLRLCGALHNLVLAGADRKLSSVWPPQGKWEELDDASFRREIAGALQRNDAAIARFVRSVPQTNEIRRSAVLLPALYLISARYRGLPIRLLEVGASAGLNLLPDCYFLKAGDAVLGNEESAVRLEPEWRGEQPDSTCPPNIVSRRGCDLKPVDISNEEAQLRLLSYIWPDQPERLALCREAIRTAAELMLPVPEAADAADWLENVLLEPQKDTVTVVQHTIAWQYLPEAARLRGEAAIRKAGEAATWDAPLARIAMEADDTGRDGAAVTLTLWPGGTVYDLGRADFHGRWIDFRLPVQETRIEG